MSMALVFAVAAGVAVAAAALAILSARSRAGAPAPGAADVGTLSACPGSPNCVTSHAADPRHAVDPIRFEGPPAIAWERLRTLLASLPQARTAAERPGYLHVEFRSRFFGFVDDAEFLLDASNQRIDVRSASRVGWSDLGANRRRMTLIARRFDDSA